MKDNQKKVEIPQADKKVTVRLLTNPTGKYHMANDYGDVLTLSPELAQRMLKDGDAELVK